MDQMCSTRPSLLQPLMCLLVFNDLLAELEELQQNKWITLSVLLSSAPRHHLGKQIDKQTECVRLWQIGKQIGKQISIIANQYVKYQV